MNVQANVSKMSNLSLEVEKEKNQLPIAGPSNEQPPPKIFKLDIDCMDEMFEYLSLEDLDAFAQTCKAMHKVAGEYFKRNYSNARILLEGLNDKPKLVGISEKHSYSSSTFNQFVDTIKFNRCIQDFALHPNELVAINRLWFECSKLNEEVINSLNGIFPKLESVLFDCTKIEVNLYDMLKQCENLKILGLLNSDQKTHIWMRHKYPKLERLDLAPIPSIDDLKTFFRNNPNVQRFFTNLKDLWEHRNEIMSFDVQLDLLEIFIRDSIKVDFSALLNQLYERKFYKRLHVFIFKIDDSFSIELPFLRGLEFLVIGKENYLSFLPDLPDVKGLRFNSRNNSLDPNLIPKKFVSLQKLSITNANDETIMSIIRGLPKLKTLTLKYDEDDEKNKLKLRTLNTERGKVFEAQKVTIFVSDEVFLKTKWSCGNGDINLEMVEMKRIA